MPSQGIAEGDIIPMSDLTSCQQASWGGAESSPPDACRTSGDCRYSTMATTVRHQGRSTPSVQIVLVLQVKSIITGRQIYPGPLLRLAFGDFSYPAYDASQACLPLTSRQWQERNIIGMGEARDDEPRHKVKLERSTATIVEFSARS